MTTLRIYLLALAVGIGLASLMPRLQPSFLITTLVAAVLCAAACWRWRRRGLRVLLCLLLGAGWSMAYGLWILDHLLPSALEQQSLRVVGRVRGLPQLESGEGQSLLRFELAVDRADCSPRCDRFPRGLSLSWRDAPQLLPGQRWQLDVKLRRPHGLMNPGGFDYQTWLTENGIGGVGHVLARGENHLLGRDNLSADYWRWQVARYLDSRLQGLASAPLLKALLIADRRDIPQRQWQLFRRHGIIHLMVISGLHIGLVSGLVFAVVRLCILAAGVTACPDRVAAVAAVLAALLYCLAAGASLPTRRALVMVVTFMVMLILRREPVSSGGLLLALLLCLVGDPLAVCSASFWLSFAAVFVLMAGLTGRIHAPARLRTVLRSQWLVFAGMIPVLALSFGQLALDSPLVNLAAIPLFSLAVVPMDLLALLLSRPLPVFARQMWSWADTLLGWLLQWLHTLDRALPQALVPLPSVPAPLAVLAVMGSLLLIAPRGMPLRYLGAPLLLALFCYRPPAPAEGELNLDVLDVGQGLSVVIETAEHVLVYDVGARFQLDKRHYFSMAEAALVPFLRSRGIDRVDTLVLSHGDNDHAGGWPELLDALPVSRVYAGEPIPRLPSSDCHRQRAWRWDGVDFRFLSVPLPANAPANNHSCVLQVSAGGYRFLLPGDIEEPVEKALVRHFHGELASAVLVAPHHGSDSSSSWALLKAVEPQQVVFSAGYRNRFGHPHRQVLRRYRVFNTSQHNTSVDGEVEFRLRANKLLTPTHYRDRVQHYWLWASGGS